MSLEDYEKVRPLFVSLLSGLWALFLLLMGFLVGIVLPISKQSALYSIHSEFFSRFL
jgi:hypothetical protein